MKQMLKLFAVLTMPLVLTGCLFLPGKFDATLKLMKGGAYQFTYVGEMQILAGDDKDMTQPKLESFDPENARCSDLVDEDGSTRPNHYYDRHAGDGSEAVEVIEAGEIAPRREKRACSDEELAELKQKETDAYERRKKDYDQRSSMMAGMFGGAIPGNDQALERFAETMRKYDGWDKIEYAGNNVFNVEYRASGNFDRYFAFPILNNASIQYPFFQIIPRKSGELELLAPGLGGQGGLMGMAMLGGGFPGNGNKDMPIKPIEGSFTLETDGEILANNSPDGYQTDRDTKTISWDVKGLKESPRALIRLK